jgi:hypothetical protein
VQLLDEVVLDRAREIASTRGVARAVLPSDANIDAMALAVLAV